MGCADSPINIHISPLYIRRREMDILKVARWGNSLAIRLPAKMVKDLDIREGDLLGRDVLALRKSLPKLTPNEAADGIRAMQRQMPVDWKLDRDDPDMRG
jgi:antitoxin MazE